MVRPGEFDREQVLGAAIDLFWSRGFAATSTDDLLVAMKIERQSLYNAFGDKRRLYVEAIQTYRCRTIGDPLSRLTTPASPLAGITALLVGVVSEEDARRGLGCMGVGSVAEFGVTDPELIGMLEKIGTVLHARVIERICEGQEKGRSRRA